MLTTSSHRRVLTKRLLMLPLALLTSAMGCAQHWTPDAATIHKVESDIQTSDIPLPYSSGHRPVIAQYARYYSAYRANGHRMITGELVLPWDKDEARGRSIWSLVRYSSPRSSTADAPS